MKVRSVLIAIVVVVRTPVAMKTTFVMVEVEADMILCIMQELDGKTRACSRVGQTQLEV